MLWWLSGRDLPPVGPTFDHADKLKHVVYFALGGYCAGRFLLLSRREWTRRAFISAVVVFAALVGAADEFHQTFTPGRSGNDPLDWLADTLGGALSALWLWCRRPEPSVGPAGQG
jgi:VanZ family protein